MSTNILYTFRRCPFAIRARWAIIMTGEIVEWREVSLRNKPKELLELSPKGTVPVLATSEGEVIEESLDIMNWALKRNNNLTIFSKNITSSNKFIKDLIQVNDIEFKYHLDRYKYAARFDLDKKIYHREKAREILVSWNERFACQNNQILCWLTGEEETLADWAIWPFVRQYRITDKEYFDSDLDIKQLKQWLLYYINNKKFDKLMQPSKPWSTGDELKLFPPN